jgi:TRAP-type uncharacterized transport system substrate-binding protein
VIFRITIFFLAICLSGCSQRKQISVLVGFEEPQNQIARTIAEIVNQAGTDSVVMLVKVDSLSATEVLLQNKADLAIVDNYREHNENIKTVVPLFDQILHLLVKDDLAIKENTVPALLSNRKVYAGEPSSSTRRFVNDLITDYNIPAASVEFVDALDLFDADVIFSFTDLLSQDELKDLTEYRFYTFDTIGDLHNGSLIEGLCARHPEFHPHVINRELYGSFTPQPVVTVAFKSILAARADLSDETVYDVLQNLEAHKTRIASLNPLLYDFSTDFNRDFLTFAIHPGATQYLNRFEPVFIQKYADLLGVLISIAVAFGSLSYSFRQWRNARKKNKIDIFYGKLMDIRSQIFSIHRSDEVHQYMAQLKSIQEETMQLVMKEKLNADESFLIFLSVSKIIHDDLKEKLQTLSVTQS